MDNVYLERYDSIREGSRRMWTKVRNFHRSKLGDLNCELETFHQT